MKIGRRHLEAAALHIAREEGAQALRRPLAAWRVAERARELADMENATMAGLGNWLTTGVRNQITGQAAALGFDSPMAYMASLPRRERGFFSRLVNNAARVVNDVTRAVVQAGSWATPEGLIARAIGSDTARQIVESAHRVALGTASTVATGGGAAAIATAAASRVVGEIARYQALRAQRDALAAQQQLSAEQAAELAALEKELANEEQRLREHGVNPSSVPPLAPSRTWIFWTVGATLAALFLARVTS